MISVIEAWKPTSRPSVRDSRGPERVVTDQPDPDFKPRPVGFTARLITPAKTHIRTTITVPGLDEPIDLG